MTANSSTGGSRDEQRGEVGSRCGERCEVSIYTSPELLTKPKLARILKAVPKAMPKPGIEHGLFRAVTLME